MNEIIMLHDVSPAELLQNVLEKSIPLNVSYFAGRRWHLANALVTEVRTDNFEARIVSQNMVRAANILVDQHLGVSFRLEFAEDNFVFDSAVVALKSVDNTPSAQKIVMAMPEQVEMVRKRNYLRVCVPPSISVDVQLRRNSTSVGPGPAAEVYHSWHAKLIDISAGGLQLAIDQAQAPDLQKDQFVIVKFASSPHETPLTFNAYVRKIVRTSSSGSICIGLEIVGLEASPEGRMILQRICCIIEQYSMMNKMKT